MDDPASNLRERANFAISNSFKIRGTGRRTSFRGGFTHLLAQYELLDRKTTVGPIGTTGFHIVENSDASIEMQFGVGKKSTLQSPVTVLDAASATSGGGGYKGGVLAQEEHLVISSVVLAAILNPVDSTETRWNRYTNQRETKNKGFFTHARERGFTGHEGIFHMQAMLPSTLTWNELGFEGLIDQNGGTGYMIFAPLVPFVQNIVPREDTLVAGYPQYEEYANVISVAAPNAGSARASKTMKLRDLVDRFVEMWSMVFNQFFLRTPDSDKLVITGLGAGSFAPKSDRPDLYKRLVYGVMVALLYEHLEKSPSKQVVYVAMKSADGELFDVLRNARFPRRSTIDLGWFLWGVVPGRRRSEHNAVFTWQEKDEISGLLAQEKWKFTS